MKCKDCNGESLVKCKKCSGEGFDYGIHQCASCSGEGEYACPTCGGTGKVKLFKKLKSS
ncbi:hypothetical protein GH741_00245 [Aquibacillus halophilus]|uniref:Molecular chaperone DnaJ n=1 Tax=Aquibacillus halophilus TaxID=930132 RepID=A0A6A8DBF5_9BACI|nr:hypothetical protein [Aquibacillus halophilus]MRH41101.1 hypothetical protein [Aquibacillus halophilus]